MLFDGTKHSGILISNATAIVAMREHLSLPFSIDSVEFLYQDREDGSPANRDGWALFDKW